MRELICSLPERFGMTVLVSSHLLSEIDQMATHVGIINRGELLFQDSLASLHQHSRTRIRIRTTGRGALTGSWRGSPFRCGRIQRMGSFFSIQRRTRRFSAAEGFCQNMISACSGWKSSR